MLKKEVLISKNVKDYLKLVMNCLMNDTNLTRIVNMLKRLLQSSFIAETQVICCILIIVSHVINKSDSLWKFVDSLKFNTNSTNFTVKTVDAKNENITEKGIIDNLTKRDPRYSLENSLFELSYLANHYHPTIQKWARSIIENHKIESIQYDGDPLMDFSLVNFLHKFITKNPRIKNLKKTKEQKLNKTTKEDNIDEDNENKKVESLAFIDKFTKSKKESNSILNKQKKAKMTDIEDFADKVIEDEINKMDVGGDDFSEDSFVSDNDEIDAGEAEEEEEEQVDELSDN